MNLVLLRPGERIAEDAVRLEGQRARHVVDVIGARPGDALRVGIPDGPRGRAVVSQVGEGTVDLVIESLDTPPGAPPRLDLILAMPRPKVLGRILEQVVALGVGRIAVTRSWRVEKSYLRTERLAPAAIEERVWAGLEQACDTRIPDVRVFDRFRPFVEDDLDALFSATVRLVAHPAAPRPLESAGLERDDRAVIAIGPEGGWIPFEIELLGARGFTPVTMGERILRVETACIAAFAQLRVPGRR